MIAPTVPFRWSTYVMASGAPFDELLKGHFCSRVGKALWALSKCQCAMV